MMALVVSLMIVGHRGASGHAPENTIAAFEKAIDLKADAVELDIQASKDGVPVVLHDNNLERTASVKRMADTLTAKELARYHIPTYADVLAMAKGQLSVFTELKAQNEEAVAAQIAKAVAEGWTYEQLPVIGFNHAQLERLKLAHPDIVTGATFSREMLEEIPRSAQAEYMVSAAQAIGAAAINPDYRLITGDVVRQAHKAGLKVNVWTVNSSRDIRTMIAFDVDAIMSDFPDRVYAELHDD